MIYSSAVTLKDGRTCTIRSGAEEDAEGVLANFLLTHAETDFLTTYPEETPFTVEFEKEYLKRKAAAESDAALVAEIGGKIVGTAGVDRLSASEKVRHRAHFGISIEKASWGLGIGRALMNACIACARQAGYLQLELEVVADNKRAVALYQSAGFTEYGRNPKGFRSRQNGWQEIILMRLDLDA